MRVVISVHEYGTEGEIKKNRGGVRNGIFDSFKKITGNSIGLCDIYLNFPGYYDPGVDKVKISVILEGISESEEGIRKIIQEVFSVFTKKSMNIRIRGCENAPEPC